MDSIFEKVEIKQEKTDGNLEDSESPTADGKTKCGEVFSTHTGSLILVCGLCESEFDSLRMFGKHIQTKHQDELFESDLYAVSIPATTEPIKREDDWPPTRNGSIEELQSNSEKTEDCNSLPVVNSMAFRCEACNIWYKSKKSLKRHQKSKRCALSEEIGPETIATETAQESSVKMEVDFAAECDSQSNEKATEEYIEIQIDSDPSSTSESDTEIDILLGNLFPCDQCDRKYKIKRSLAKHKKRSHSVAPCDDLPQEIVNQALFCVPCNKQLFSRTTFQRHKRIHSVGGNIRLAYNKKSITQLSTNESQQSDPPKDDQQSPDPKQQKDPGLFCEFCKKHFKNLVTLRNHAVNHALIPEALKDDEEILKCKYCWEKLPDLASRRQHEANHSGDKAYECPYCEKKFTSHSNRSMHVRVHTGETPHVCPHCSKPFSDAKDLRRHVERHLNIRNFPCEYCDKKFFRLYELIKHTRTHTKEKPYICDVCGREFAELAPMKGHRRRHFGVKDHKCDICEREFYSLGDLKVHRVSHFSDKPFECEVCGRKFSRPEAKKKHMKLHSDIKSYVCNICGKAYAQDSGLYAHKKSHGRAV